MNSQTQKFYFIGVLLALSGTLLFSAKSIFIKKVYQYGVDADSLIVLRMAMAVPFYLIVYMLNKKSRGKAMSIKEFFAVVAIGVIGYYVASYLDLTGLLYISASFERMILYLFPSFVLIISVVFLNHKFKLSEALAFLLSYLGIIVIYAQDFQTGGYDVTYGMVLVLGSAMSFSVFVVLSGQYIAKVGSVQFTSVSMMGAGVAVFFHYLISTPANVTDYDSQVYGLIFVLALFCTVLPSYLINMGVKRLGAPRVAILGTISPVFTVIMAYAFLDEVSTLMHMLGFLLVILGIAIITMAKHHTVVQRKPALEKAGG